MILSDLLGLPVLESGGGRIGGVSDARFVQTDGKGAPDIRLFGLLVSPRSRASTFGYERRNVRAPAPIAAFVRWRHRGTFLVRWEDVAEIGPDGVRLRPGYRRYSPELPEQPQRRPSSAD
jgi:sporulation protein YlmC with PRC-barrel domain